MFATTFFPVPAFPSWAFYQPMFLVNRYLDTISPWAPTPSQGLPYRVYVLRFLPVSCCSRRWFVIYRKAPVKPRKRNWQGCISHAFLLFFSRNNGDGVCISLPLVFHNLTPSYLASLEDLSTFGSSVQWKEEIEREFLNFFLTWSSTMLSCWRIFICSLWTVHNTPLSIAYTSIPTLGRKR